MRDVQYGHSFLRYIMAHGSDILALAAKLLMEYEKHPVKADEFIESKYTFFPKYGEERRVCQFIFSTVLRNKLIIESILAGLLPKPPRPGARSLLKCAAAEIIASAPEKRPQVVHAWVGACKRGFSEGEARMANAVLRRFAQAYDAAAASASSLKDFALLYSHPLWLAKSWADTYGEEKAVEIMRSNSKTPEIWFRIPQNPDARTDFAPFSRHFEESAYPGFFRLKPGRFGDAAPLLETPSAYVQDPATRMAPEILAPKPGERILDLCAAPGGKSRTIADMLRDSGADLSSTLLVSADMPGRRLERLRENLSKISFMRAECAGCDLLAPDLAGTLAALGLPAEFDAILLDAPCSNTGVLRRRPDARYRLSERDIPACAQIQEEMLKNALPLLAPGGRLAYSTCSIEPLENKTAPRRAIAALEGFEIESEHTILPGETDGAGIALIRRQRSVGSKMLPHLDTTCAPESGRL